MLCSRVFGGGAETTPVVFGHNSPTAWAGSVRRRRSLNKFGVMTKPGYIVLPDDGGDPWRAMRKRRASPSISGAARVTTFRTALEQAEQQFKAAASVGPESRPLNVFYGLSQAGRAIAAAAKSLTTQDWLLKGHGIRTEAMDTAALIADVKVVPETGLKSSFGRLSSVLGSAIPTCTLGDIWTRIWDAAAFEPLQPSRTDIPLLSAQPNRPPPRVGSGPTVESTYM